MNRAQKILEIFSGSSKYPFTTTPYEKGKHADYDYSFDVDGSKYTVEVSYEGNTKSLKLYWDRDGSTIRDMYMSHKAIVRIFSVLANVIDTVMKKHEVNYVIYYVDSQDLAKANMYLRLVTKIASKYIDPSKIKVTKKPYGSLTEYKIHLRG